MSQNGKGRNTLEISELQFLFFAGVTYNPDASDEVQILFEMN